VGKSDAENHDIVIRRSVPNVAAFQASISKAGNSFEHSQGSKQNRIFSIGKRNKGLYHQDKADACNVPVSNEGEDERQSTF
jgi:hypothetical protein